MGMDSVHRILYMEDFNMRSHFLNVIRSIAFLSILEVSLYFINRVLMPKYILANNTWPTTSTYYQFYDMEEDSVDVLFFGSSICVNAFCPQEIYNEYGITSYNLGSEQQSIILSYYWLKEALRFQSPKVVVLDTRFLFDSHEETPINMTEGMIRKCMDPMRWSAVKREAVSAICELDEKQSELSYYFTNIRFHTRWESLTEYDFIEEEYTLSELKGYGPIEEYGADTYDPYTPSGDTETKQEPQAVMLTYLDKTVELCREEGIALVLLSLPGSPMSDGINNMLNEYAKSNAVDYYNLCERELYNSIGATLPRENMILHGNIWGAIKMSRFMGGLLCNTYGVEAVVDDQYEATRDFYERIKQNCELVHITDMNEYLWAIADKNYTIFISICEEGTAGLTDSIREILRYLGLGADFDDMFRSSYCAVISPGAGVYEEAALEQVAFTGTLRDHKSIYTLISGGHYGGSTSSIVIDGEEYAINYYGMNFVIYDSVLGEVVDHVCFETNQQGCGARR